MYHVKKLLPGGFHTETLLSEKDPTKFRALVTELGITGDVLRRGQIRVYNGARRLTIGKFKATFPGLVT